MTGKFGHRFKVCARKNQVGHKSMTEHVRMEIQAKSPCFAFDRSSGIFWIHKASVFHAQNQWIRIVLSPLFQRVQQRFRDRQNGCGFFEYPKICEVESSLQI